MCLLSCYCSPPSAAGAVAEVVAAALPVAKSGSVDVTFILVVAFGAGVGTVSVSPAILSWLCHLVCAFTSLAASTTASASLVSSVASLVSSVASLVSSVISSLISIVVSARVVVVVVVAVSVAVAIAVTVAVVAVVVVVSDLSLKV